jgi:hypothetical protein
MKTPGFTAEAATVGRGWFFGMRAYHANRSSADIVTMAAQCCPPGFDTTGCTTQNPPPDCSTIRCPKGLVCCDCTVTHCTTPAECRRECSL